MAGVSPKANLLLTPLLKLIVAVVGLLILQFLVSSLPMVREIPVPASLPLPVIAIAKIVIATVILALLVNFAFEIGDNLEVTFPAFPQGGVMVRWFVLLVAVLIAYWAYHILAETFLGSYSWAYSLMFLGLALVPLISLVVLNYQHIDTLIDLAMGRMQTFRAERLSTSRIREQLLCAGCDATLQTGAKFCRKCGTPVATPATATKVAWQCANCGSSLSAGVKFCSDCGAPATSA